MKYSINSNGFIVAERDIYSLGGFIPKNSVGAKVANEDQISQDGECWVAGGDISGRPDVRVKDNAYIGDFVGATGMHTDGVTEFSGDTLIPGKIIVRNPIADPVNNFFAKDSFIGISMDVLCGPSTTTTAFPFVQGRLDHTKPAGTPTAGMAVVDANSCFSNAVMRCGNDTQIYVPANVTARVLWIYNNVSNATVYSGESELLQPGLKKVSHPTYKVGFVVFSSASAMTPAQLGTSGAKILGHVSGSLLQDLRPESVSGSYVMDKSSFLMNTDNFGLATTQLRYLAGSMYDTNMYTPGGSTDYKVYGTFHNVQRLEYAMFLGAAHRTNVNRDRYISAYDCPLLRIDDTTYNDALAAKGNLVLRRCIVPKAEFQDDVINGNTYEDIDFSYANEDLGFTIAGYTRFISSPKQGIYRLSGGSSSTGFASHKGNLADTARLYQAEKYISLDGSIMEQGLYGGGSPGTYYESAKSAGATRVRTGKPLPTFGLVFPSLPAGYSVKALYYLDEDFIIRSSVMDPTGVDTTYPYVVMVFRKDGDSAITVTDFIALNRTLRMIDHTKAPEITGSAYVGAGCTVRGDVKLIGDPYVNRVFDVNMWERGTGDSVTGETWEGLKRPEAAGYPRLRTRGVFPVDTTVDNNFTCASGYKMLIYYFGEDGKCSGWSPWGTSLTVSDPAVAYISILVSKTNGTDFMDGSDIPLANVKYVRAFKKRRYIVNELDRTSPEDILLSVDYWEQGSLSLAAGTPYEASKIASLGHIRLKRPLNAGGSSITTIPSGYLLSRYKFDALTKYVPGAETDGDRALYGGILRKDPSGNLVPTDVTSARIVIEFVPQPRIVVPYGSSSLFISGPKIRMYDNAVLSRNIGHDAGIVLQGDAIMGYDFNSGPCMCSNGHSDAIIKLP
ncbi:hypothetical protein BT681P2_00026 [Bacteroides phage BT681P2]|nr:hypothetical protein BT681P2_00026 [Bacteroides phage BT681P2]